MSTPSLVVQSDPPETAFSLKVDFHLHAGEDPLDELEYSAVDVLYRARALGFGALAITLHDHVLHRQELFDIAKSLGLLLIPAAEVRLEGADVVVLNISEEEAGELRRIRDLEALRKRRGNSVFIFAPHPYYLLGGSMGERRLVENIDLFDAIEMCHFHTRVINPNRGAIRVAQRFNKPMIATSDAHRLDSFGSHFTRVPVKEVSPEAIFNAIRAGNGELVSPPLSAPRFLQHLWWIFAEHRMRVIQARLAGH